MNPFPRLLNLLAPPGHTPGRRRSYHPLILASAAVLLAVVLLAPLRVAGVIAIRAFLAWWFADSLRREGT